MRIDSRRVTGVAEAPDGLSRFRRPDLYRRAAIDLRHNPFGDNIRRGDTLHHRRLPAKPIENLRPGAAQCGHAMNIGQAFRDPPLGQAIQCGLWIACRDTARAAGLKQTQIGQTLDGQASFSLVHLQRLCDISHTAAAQIQHKPVNHLVSC